MKLQLTKTKSIELPFGKKGGDGGRSAVSDLVGVELFGGDERGVPAVRLAYKKSAWHLLAAGFLNNPPGELPEQWEDVSHRSTWELPSVFQAPHAAIAVNSMQAIFSQATPDNVVQDMMHGVPTGGAAAEPTKKSFGINAKNGKITVKKDLAKGTYKVTVKATAKGNANCKKGSKTAVVTVKVK